MIAKTSCQHCGIHIEFETDNAQENVPCPLCGGKTEWRGDNAKQAANRPDVVQTRSEIQVKPVSRPVDLANVVPDLASVAPEVESVVEADTTITTAAAVNHVPKPVPVPEPVVAAERVEERVEEPSVERPAEPMIPVPVVPMATAPVVPVPVAPAPAKRPVGRSVERDEMLRLGPKAHRAPVLDALTFSSALKCFAGIALVCAVIGGVMAAQRDHDSMMFGLEIFAFGILIGLVLVGFGCLVEYTKAGLDRLERLEQMIEKIANDRKSE
jgi:predicted RNA-binding Zn-ribbon protein involved in translation (DUF1610 family)